MPEETVQLLNLYGAAEEYLKYGLKPIPFEFRKKETYVKWSQYQNKAPTIAEIEAWWANGQQTNIGTVVGNGIMVVDLDGGHAAEKMLNDKGIYLPTTAPRVLTGSGYHVYLSVDKPVPDRIGLLNTNGGKPQVDIRGVGCAILPPSIHPNGKHYQWVVPLEGKPPSASPALLDLIFEEKKYSAVNHDPGWAFKALTQGAPEGGRNNLCTRLAGYLLGKKIDTDMTEEILLRTFAQSCKPPFSPQEVRVIVQSISARNGTEGPAERSIIPQHISNVSKRLLENLSGEPPKVYETSFPKLDWLLCGGFAPGNLTYMGARPGVGKTAIALQMAVNVASKGSRVLIVTREMENVALLRRMVAQTGKVEAHALRQRKPLQTLIDTVTAVLKKMSTLPIWMSEQATSIGEITDMVAKSSSRNEGCLVIVDHLQLVRAPDVKGDKRAQIEAVSQGLKTLALQFKIPVLCMSTLARPFDKKNPRPTIDSLRESGELEHDADIILLLHRAYNSHEAEIEVAKNRDGHVGSVNLIFEPQYVAFTAIDDSEAAPERPNRRELYRHNGHKDIND